MENQIDWRIRIVSYISFSRKYVAISSSMEGDPWLRHFSKKLCLYNCETLELIMDFPFDDYHMIFSFCDRYLAGSLKIIDLQKPKNIVGASWIFVRIAALNFFGFNQDGKYFLQIKNENRFNSSEMQIKQVNTFLFIKEKKNLLNRKMIGKVFFSYNSQFFAAVNKEGIFIYLVENQKFFKMFRGHCCEEKPAIEWFESFLASRTGNNAIKIWNIYDESIIKEIKTERTFDCFKIAPDGKKIALYYNWNNNVDILDIDSNQIISRINSSDPWRYAELYWTRCWIFTFVLIKKNEIKIFRADNQNFLIKTSKNETFTSAKISYSEYFLITSGEIKISKDETRYNITVWYLGDIKNDNKKVIKVKEIPVDCAIKSIVMSPDRKSIIACDKNGNTRILDYKSGKLIKTIAGYHESIDFLARGNFVIGSNWRNSKIYESDRFLKLE